MKYRNSSDRCTMARMIKFLAWVLVALIPSATLSIAYAQEVPPALLGDSGRLRMSQAQCLTRAEQAIRAAQLTLNPPPAHPTARGGYNRYLSTLIGCLTADGGLIFVVHVAGLPGYNPATVRTRDFLGEYMRSGGSSSRSQQPGNGATYVSQSAPATMIAGRSYRVSISMRNSGTSTWTAADSYGLGSQNPQDNRTWGGARVNMAASIPPNANATFSFTVVAPSTPGTYNFQWRMLREGVEWFGDYTPNVQISVTNR